MPIKLIDPNATVRVTIQGTVFHIKALTNGQRLKLGKDLEAIREDEVGYDEMFKLLGATISKIDGFEGQDPGEVMVLIEDAKVQGEIIKAVLSKSTLSSDEAGNSGSSSGTSPTIQAGDAGMTIPADKDAASTEAPG